MKKKRRRWAGLLLAIALLAALVAGCSGTNSSGPPTVVGMWNVTYGNPTLVSISLTSADAYSMTASSPVTLTGGSPCQLPIGTPIATFSGGGSSYTGQHGLWHTSDCSFAVWTPLHLTLNDNTLTAKFDTGGTINFTRLPVPTNHRRLWPWLLLVAVLICGTTCLLLHRKLRLDRDTNESATTR